MTLSAIAARLETLHSDAGARIDTIAGESFGTALAYRFTLQRFAATLATVAGASAGDVIANAATEYFHDSYSATYSALQTARAFIAGGYAETGEAPEAIATLSALLGIPSAGEVATGGDLQAEACDASDDDSADDDDSSDDDDCVECCDCDESIARDDSRTSNDGSVYCESCYDDAYTACHHCSEELDSNDHRDTHNGDACCESCFSRRYVECAECDTIVRQGYGSNNSDGQTVCDGCAENYSSCEECNDVVHNDNLCYSERRESYYCSDCYPGNGTGGDVSAKRFYLERATLQAETRSARTFGVELETSECSNSSELDGYTHFSSKDDGSIDGLEFVSEVLRGDDGLRAIRDFCDRANRADFEVDSKCGFHAHFGAGDLSREQLQSVAIAYRATYNVWSAFVNSERRANSYCGPSRFSIDDCLAITDFRRFARNQDRYQWVNFAAYSAHSTIEVRLHTATLNGEKVCNWIKAHARFIDFAATLSPREAIRTFYGASASENFATLSAIWNDDALSAYYRDRAAKFGIEFDPSAAPAIGARLEVASASPVESPAIQAEALQAATDCLAPLQSDSAATLATLQAESVRAGGDLQALCNRAATLATVARGAAPPARAANLREAIAGAVAALEALQGRRFDSSALTDTAREIAATVPALRTVADTCDCGLCAGYRESERAALATLQAAF